MRGEDEGRVNEVAAACRNNAERMSHLMEQVNINKSAIDVMSDRAKKLGLEKEFLASTAGNDVFPLSGKGANDKFSYRVLEKIKGIGNAIGSMMHADSEELHHKERQNNKAENRRRNRESRDIEM